MKQDIKKIAISLIITIGILYQSFNAGQFWHSLSAFQNFGIWFSMGFALLPEIAGAIIAAWRPIENSEKWVRVVSLSMIFGLALVSGSIGHIKGIISASELSETDMKRIAAVEEQIEAAKQKAKIANEKAKTVKVSKKYITADTDKKTSAQSTAINASSDVKADAIKLEKLVLELENKPNPRRMIKWVEAVAILAGFGLLQILIWILSFLGFAKPDVLRETIEKKIVQSPVKIEQILQKTSDDFANFSDVEKKILQFFDRTKKAEITWTGICQRRLGNAGELETALNNLAEKNLVIFNKPSDERGKWTVKGV